MTVIFNQVGISSSPPNLLLMDGPPHSFWHTWGSGPHSAKSVRDPLEYTQHRPSICFPSLLWLGLFHPNSPLSIHEVSSGRIKETYHRRLSILIEPNFQSRIPIKSRDIDTDSHLNSAHSLQLTSWLTVHNQSHVTGTITVTLDRQPVTQNQSRRDTVPPLRDIIYLCFIKELELPMNRDILKNRLVALPIQYW